MDDNDIALTTSDNPWSPFTQFDEWYAFDTTQKHYNTCSYLAKFAPTSIVFSNELNDRIINNAIDEIVNENIIGLVTGGQVNYIKAHRSDYTP